MIFLLLNFAKAYVFIDFLLVHSTSEYSKKKVLLSWYEAKKEKVTALSKLNSYLCNGLVFVTVTISLFRYYYCYFFKCYNVIYVTVLDASQCRQCRRPLVKALEVHMIYLHM